MKEYRNLTIFFVSFFSSQFIEKILKKIESKINILIIDNANEKGLKKKYFEGKFRNVKVIVSKKNNGQTGGINIGFKKYKNKVRTLHGL